MTRKHLRKKYCKKGVVACKSIRKLIWLNIETAVLKCFKNILKFLGKHKWCRPLIFRCTAYSQDVTVDRLPYRHFLAVFLNLMTILILPVGKL